ncbi:octopamine receptor Oamb-like [Leucoraja erinacea]|uniref:octopamine receptor Oamb-like n=1 Tax=Leucoraja erinaceus TaxID=7782 RepID=UPI002457A296|nr:octopamine receptor Oamb-like [Leucoraja erinacea]
MEGLPTWASGGLGPNGTGPEQSPVETVARAFLYLLVLALGLPLNALVLALIFRSRSLRSVANMFVASLATADLLLLLLGLPFVVAATVAGAWPLGPTACQMTGFLTFSLRLVSILSVAGISVDRYYLIARPFILTVTRAGAKRTLAFLWWTGLLCGLPPLFGIGLYRFSPSKGLCDYSWPDGGSSLAYGLHIFIWVYLTSVVVVTTSYYLIYRVTRQRLLAKARRSPHSLSSDHNGTLILQEPKAFRHSSLPRMWSGLMSSSSIFNLSGMGTLDVAMETKTAKTILGVVATFLVTWLPYFVSNLRRRHALSQDGTGRMLDFLATWLTFTNCVLDPLLYAFLNRQIRRRARELLGLWFGLLAQPVSGEVPRRTGRGPTRDVSSSDMAGSPTPFSVTQELQRSTPSPFPRDPPPRRLPLAAH